MVADTLEELHTYAAKIGLKRSYFEGVKKGHPHYDLTKGKRPNTKAFEDLEVQQVRPRDVLRISKTLIR